jgi:HYR domain
MKRSSTPTQFGKTSEVSQAGFFSTLKKAGHHLIGIVFMLLSFAWCQQTSGQTASQYTFSTVNTGSLAVDRTGNVVDMTSGTSQLVGGGQDDVASSVANIGFNFTFMSTGGTNNVFTQFSASSNGGLRLGGTAISGATQGGAFPVNGQAIIAPYLGDLATSSSGKVHYKLIGSYPNRTLVVEFLNMEINYSSTTVDGTFQVRLYEQSNIIEFVYGSMKVGGITTTASRTVAIGFSNTTGNNNEFSVNQSNYTTTTGTTPITNTNSATGSITGLNSSANGSRRVFTFIPTLSYKSQFISMSTGSSTWCVGETRNVTVTIKNIGTAVWTTSSPIINIGAKFNANADYDYRVSAAGLAPGAQATFTIPITAPSTPSSSENISFDVVKELQCWFRDNTAGCAGPGNMNFVGPTQVVTGPTASAGNALSTICQGGTSAALGGSVGGSATGGTWSDGGVGGTFSPSASTLNATWKPPVSYTGTATLTLTTTGGTCGNATASKNEVVGASPIANAGADLSAICQGGTSLPLGGSVGGSATGGTWSSSAGGSFNPNPNTLNATWTPPPGFNGTATLTLTTTGGPCAAVADTKLQPVTASATVNAGADLAGICQGGTTGALGGVVGGSATGGNWTDGGVGGSFSPNSNSLNATWTAPATYSGTATLTLTSTGGCGNPTDTKLQLVSAGASGVSASPASSTICLGSTVPLVGSATLSGSSATVIDNFNGTPTFTVTGSSSGNRSQVWQQETSGSNVNSVATFTSPGGGSLMVSTAGGSGIFDASSVSSILTSPVINTTGFSSLSTLTFVHTYKQGGSSGSGVVQISIDGGSNWTTLATYNSNQGSSSTFASVSLNVGSYANQANLKIRFNFNTANQNLFSNTTSWWAIDDITLNGVKIPLYSWTANTPSAINGLPVGAGTPSASNKNISVHPTGTSSYTLTATNPTTNCTASGTPVIVNVNPAPTLITLTDATLNTSDDGTGNCSTLYNWSHPSVNTLCPTTLKVAYSAGTPAPSSLPANGTVIAGSAASATFFTGVTIVTYTATDQNNNTVTSNFKVTVADDELPVIDCPADVTVNNTTDQCNATVILAIPATSDNCGVASVTNDHPSNVYPTGITNVTWTVKDNSNNIKTCVQKVTVNDVQPPTITCNQDVSVNSDPGVCGATVNLTVPATNDNCGVASVTSDHSSNLFPVGSTIVKWTVTDNSGNIATCNQTVTVTDNEKPVITCPTSITTVTDAAVSYATITLLQPMVTDNCGVASVVNDHSTSSQFPIGTTLVTWTATDVNGNMNTCIQTIVVNDTIQPSIAFNPAISVNNNPGLCLGSIDVNYPEASDNSGHVTVTSNYAGLATASIDPVVPLLVNSVQFPVGATTIVWTATDPSDNSTSSTQTVTVVDNEKPTITCPGDISKNNDPGLCSAVIDLGTPVTSDNCGVASVTNDHPSNVFIVGETIVTWTVTDIHGNINTCSQKVTVTDTEIPTIASASDVNVNSDHGQCAASITLTAPATNDNCGIQSVENDHPSTSFVVGTTMVTWTVTDIHGNTNSTVQKVVVTDNELPVITVADVLVNNDAGLCSATVTPLSTATDNCSVGLPIGTRSDALALTDPYPVGNTTITWNVSDVHGNTALPQVQIVTVKDNAPPLVLTQNITVQLDALGNASITPEQIDNGSADNCGIATRTLDINTFSCANVGTPVTVTLTVTDIHGNVANSTATVTVEDNVPPVVTTQNIIVQLDGMGHAFINAGQIDNGSTDNCGIASRTVDISSFDCSNVDAPVTVTLTVTDVHGNSASKTAIVTVKDYIAPVVATQDITVQLDATGHASITSEQIDNGSSDNCAIATRVLDISNFDCSNVGSPVTVTLTITDIHGNAASATAIVTVVDNVPPVVLTQNITVQLDASGHATITPGQIDNGSADNCSIALRTLDINNFDCSNVGSPVTVTLTVTDIHLNASNATAVVTVEDNVPPVVATKNITVQLDATGHASINAGQVDNGSADNCAIATRTLDISSFDCSNVGTPVIVTLTVTDIHGNPANATAVVTVEDNVPPVVVTHDITVQLDAAGHVSITPAQIDNGSSDNCDIDTRTLDISNFDCSNVGSPVIVTLTVTDIHGNHASATALVTVVDNIKPTVITQPVTVYLDASGAATVTAAQVNNGSTDNCSISSYSLDKTSFNCTNVGPNTVTLTVTDVNGNSDSKTAVVTVVDNIKPTVITQPVTVYLDASGAATVTAAQVNNGSTDNCSISSYSLDKTSFNCTNVGPNTVTLTVTDVNGNSDSKTAVVTVVDNIKPTVITQPVTIYLNASGAATVTPAQVNNGSTDNCSILSYSLDKTSFNCSNVGPNTVTLTVTDVNGNSDSKTAVVTVVDNIKPIVITQPVTVYLDASGAATVTAAQVNNGSTDNCSISSYSLNKTSFNCSNVGPNTVTLTVTDVNGNSDSNPAVVTVVDNIKPVIAPLSNIAVNNDPGVCGASVAVSASATDNCSVGTPTGVRNDGLALNVSYPVGTTTITWNVNDVNGNAATTVVQSVTVTDNEKPVISGIPANKNVVNDAGICGAKVSWTLPTASDNCAIQTFVSDYHSGDVFPVGTTTVTYTATDTHGNIKTSSFTITVSDNEKPTINCPSNIVLSACTSTASWSTPIATDNCSGVTVAQTAGPASGSVFANGSTSTITYTATDAAGNQKSCSFTVSRAAALTVTGSNSNPQLFFGYSGDQTSTVKAIASGGVAPYTIKITMDRPLKCNYVNDAGDEIWSGIGGSTINNTCPANPATATLIPVSTISGVSAGGSLSVNVTLMANTVITATVTDANGCTATYTTAITAEDVRCFAGNSGNAKVAICHQTGSTKNPCVQICVDKSAVAEHLAHGDYLGNCTPNCVAPAKTITTRSAGTVNQVDSIGQPVAVVQMTNPDVTPSGKLAVKVLPNPTSYYFTLGFESASNEKIKIIVTDVAGRVLERKSDVPANSNLQIGAHFHFGVYIAEVTQGKDKVFLRLVKGRQ